MKIPAIIKATSVCFALLASAVVSHAANGADAWVGNTTANLGDANWTGVNNPPLSGDVWLFGVAGTSGTNLNNNLTAGNSVAGITFNNGAGTFVFNNNSITLTGNVTNNSTNTETINFPIASTGTGAFLTTAGGGNIRLGGVLGDTGGGIAEASFGTLTLNGAAANTYTGPTTVNGGSFIEDFTNLTSGVNLINSSSVLTLGGGVFQVRQKGGTTTSQTFAGTTVNPGFTSVTGVTNGAGGLTLALGAIIHNIGGTADFGMFTNGAGVITATSANTNGILGGWATVGDTSVSTTTGDWAANDGLGNITNYTGYTLVNGNQVGTGAAAQNWMNSAPGNVVTLTASATINSLDQQGDFSLNNGVTLTLGSGGLIQRGVSRWMKNNGGNANNTSTTELLVSGLGTGELFIHSPAVDNSDWRIWPVIADGAVPTIVIKDGPGFASFLNDNNTYSGGTFVNGGTLSLKKAAFNLSGNELGTGTVTVNGSGTTLFFNSAGTANVANYPQSFVFNGGTISSSDSFPHLATGASATITVNGPTTLSRQWGHVTTKSLMLDGILQGSAALTLIGFGGAANEGSSIWINNANNTYSGTVTVNANTGTGGSAMVVGANTALQFASVNLSGTRTSGSTDAALLSGVQFNTNVIAPVFAALSGSGNIALQDLSAAHVAVSLMVGGNNASTAFSGVLSGAGNLTKTGTGAMLLAGANTYSGGTTNTAGTIIIGNSAALGTGLLTLNGGVLSNSVGNSSFVVPNRINLANTTSIGVGTNDSLSLLGVINNPGGVTKVGNGTLILIGPNTYSGTTTVGGGRLVVSAAQLTTSPVVVNDGTKFGVVASGASHLSPTTLTMGSSTGATIEITASSTTQAPLTPGVIVLNGVTPINVVGGVFVPGNSYPLLTYGSLSGSGSLVPGTIPGGVTGTITQTGNTYFLNVTAVANDIWTGVVNGTWDIGTTANWLTNGVAGVYFDDAQVQFDDTGLNTTTITNLAGTIVSPGGVTVTNSAKNYALKTVIAGLGGITKSGTGILTNSGANTYTGPTVINGGQVVAGVASVANVSGALGNNSAVSLANDPTALVNLNGFATQLGSLTGGGAAGGNITNAGVTLTIGGDNTSPAAYGGVISGTGGLTKIGTGALTLSNTNTYIGATVVGTGTLNVNSPGAMGAGVNTMTVGNTAGNSVVNFSGSLITYTNFNIGTVSGAVGAMYQTAGIVRANQAAGGGNFQIGNAPGAYGYYDAAGGVTTMNEIGVGGEANPSGNGVFDLNGGIVTNGGWLVMTRGGAAQIGVLNAYSGTLLYDQTGGGGLVCNWGAGQTSIINMLGGNVANIGSVNNPINLNQSGNAANTGILNCNGGVISAGWVTGGANGTRVNFNGGTLAANENQTVFMTGLAAATVYSGGGTIDNKGFSLTIAQQFLAPSGNGVKSISSFTPGAGYIAPPIVTVVNDPSDTTGIGATAIAQINPATGQVTSVLITCPGVNYTATPTFTLTGGGATTPATITGAAPTANTSGSLTFTGSGITLLTPASGAYTHGTTFVTGGTLDLNPLLPSVTDVVVTNSTLAVDASSGTPQSIGNLTLQNNATNSFSYGTVTVNPTTPAISCAAIPTPGSAFVISLTALGLQPGQFPLIQYTGAPMSAGQFSKFGLNPPPGVVATLSNNTVSLTIDVVITSAPKQLTWYGAGGTNWDYTTVNWKFTNSDTIYQQYTNGFGVVAGDGVTFDDTLTNDGVNPQPTTINLTGMFTPYPVIVNSSLNYSLAGTNGGIIGSAYLLKTNSGSLTLLTSNSFTGGISIGGGGSLIITNDNALGAVSVPVVPINASTLQMDGNTTNNTRGFTITGASSIGVLTNTVARFGGPVTGSGALTKIDNGTLVLAGVDTGTGALSVNAGTLSILGAVTNPAQISVTGPNGAVLSLSTGTLIGTKNSAPTIQMGSSGSDSGALHMTSGTMISTSELWLATADGQYGSFTMDGGTAAVGSWLAVARGGGSGNFTMNGGTLTVSGNNLTIGSLGGAAVNSLHAVTTLTGGTLNTVNTAANQGNVYVGEGNSGILNVMGTAALNVSGARGVDIGVVSTTPVHYGIVNLLGGTITTPVVRQNTAANTAIFDFNGGTLKAGTGAASAFMSGLDAAYVYSGGAIIDDGGNSITISQPLLAPSSNGVSTITLSYGGSGYVGAPNVEITGGSGSGATAIAQINAATGVITNILVTSPGSGYAVADSLTVSLNYGGINDPAQIGTITLAPNVSGGLTKRGAGTLTLTGVNTFTGPITNTAGTLLLNSASTYGGMVVNGGSVSMTTASKINGNLAISNNATMIISQVGSATNLLGNLTFNGGAAVPGGKLGLGVTGFNSTAALVNCAMLTVNGTNTISVSGSLPLGAIPLIQYAGAISGSGTLTNLILPQGAGGFLSNGAASSTLFVVITNSSPGLVWSGFNTNTALTNVWAIGSTTNWLLGAALTTYQQLIIPGDVVTFNDIGTGTVLLNTNVGPASMLISNNTRAYTFNGNGAIVGSTGILKLGTNTAILNLTNDAYIGDSVINNGTLQVGAVGALSSAANLAVGSSGIVNLSGFDETVSGLSGSGMIVNSNATTAVLSVNQGGVWNGTITNGVGTSGVRLFKTGTGNLTLGGTNTFTTGGTAFDGITDVSLINGGSLTLNPNSLVNIVNGGEFFIADLGTTGSVTNNGGILICPSWLVVGRNGASSVGTLVVNSGTVQKTGGNNLVVGSLNATGTLVVNGGQVLNNGNLWLGESPGAVASLYLNGGLIQATQVRENNSGGLPTTPGVAYLNGGTLQATAPSASFIQDITPMVMSNGVVLDDNGFTLSIGLSAFQNGDGLGGGLVKTGSGSVYLDAGNSYTGTTVVTNGTLAGIGSVVGNVTVGPAGNLGAGDAAGVGTFTIGGNLALNGNATLRVNNTGGTMQQPDQVAVGGNVTYGGILTINNITADGSPLAIGESNTLFTAAGFIGSFSAIQNSPFIPGLAWSNDVANPGTFIVIANTAVAPVASFSGTPTSIFAGQSVVFANTSTGSYTSSAWSFGDGNVASLSGANAGGNVTNTYASTVGSPYTVQLIVSGPGGLSTNTQTAYITVKPRAVIGKPVLSGGNLILSGANGPAGQQYRILSSTNVALPLATGWVPVYTNVFAADGSYSYTNTPVTNSTSFFILVSP